MHTIASASTNGSLSFTGSTARNTNFAFFRNRAGYQSGDMAELEFGVGHVGDDVMDYTTPNVTWLRDGVPVSVSPTNTAPSSGALVTVLSFAFAESDAGVYQCVFTDTARSEVFVTDPIRLVTGED